MISVRETTPKLKFPRKTLIHQFLVHKEMYTPETRLYFGKQGSSTVELELQPDSVSLFSTSRLISGVMTGLVELAIPPFL